MSDLTVSPSESTQSPYGCGPRQQKLIRRLPAEYKALEQRVDGLRDVHQSLLKITRVHETEAVSCPDLGGGAPAYMQYDYPTDVVENVNEMSQQAASAWATFANKNLKVSCRYAQSRPWTWRAHAPELPRSYPRPR